ncbi:Zinc finger, C3HC4 RING-type [Kalmanozyma brasiliensis GHG001]|uniref:SNF2 family helicase/ATPase n=1 Tax=Kalmanozyma brasiliensis (strain GHG001) TaxID=1365824 RepID=V5EWS6_KALBG|nr:Zinc finger, C3HC4 RING-type [Kalmanozyma brasiliensis GHG001]EST10050.1 Zinc finger, C3HC4 RING-type [Kalmanozyma brasiliensis GHG001]
MTRTRSQSAAAKQATPSSAGRATPSSSTSSKSNGKKSQNKSTSPSESKSKASSPSKSPSPKSQAVARQSADDQDSSAKANAFVDVPTIPLFDFDLPLELDTPYGSRISAFNPAPYEALQHRFKQWFPDLAIQDDDEHDGPAQSSSSAVGQDSNVERKGGQKKSAAPAQPSSKEQNKTISSKRKGKAKKPDCIHLEVEFVPATISDIDLQLPRTSQGWSGVASSKPHNALAVVALAPPDYTPPDEVKVESVLAFTEDPAARDESPDLSEEPMIDDPETLLLGHIIPSAFKDAWHPLLHLDPTLLSKEWIQLYGEVTLAPPFLPPRHEIFGPDSWEASAKKGSTAPAKPYDPPRNPWTDFPYDVSSSRFISPEGSNVPSTRLLGVLSVQVGLEPAALQYGAGNEDVDGFVGSVQDLKDTRAAGTLGLARALRRVIPAIVDWQDGFIELDEQAHTFWDRNESFYDLPPKQRTLARHLVLDKVESVDLPASSSKSPSKKRKKSSTASRPSSTSTSRISLLSAPTSAFEDEEEPEDRLDLCLCPNCRGRRRQAARRAAEASRPAEPPRPKADVLPLGEQITSTDPRLGDITSDKFLPLDVNIASLLEACRPPLGGPEVFPPSDIIPTPLLGYQARCLAWMIKRETVVDEDVSHLMPNWFPLRCKNADLIKHRRLQLEAEREALLEAMHRGLSRSRRNALVKSAQATVHPAIGAVKSETLDEGPRNSKTASGQGGARAKNPVNSGSNLSSELKREPFIDPFDQVFYFDQVSGLLSLRRFSCRPTEPGGALCESMGLGKTLESLALIAAHPRPENPDLLAYDTSRSARMIAEMEPSERPFVSRATLVVCPAALVEQWMDEIRKHFRSRLTLDVDTSMSDDATILNQQAGVVRYKHSDFAWNVSSSRSEVRALAKERLTQPDIVVATYEELAFQLSESHRVPVSDDQVRTPLLEVHFWRILLDEAQIVAGASGKATNMVHELWRSNCWMVTGTPVTKGIRDIQGIFAFMDHDPFAAPRFFNEILQEPFTRGCVEGIRRLRAILPRFVWRHTQAHVEDEIVLPPCKSEVLEINLKHVERLFYDKEVRKFRESFAKQAARGVANVPQPSFLVHLRQLLSHPQVADELMLFHNYSRLSFAELFRRFCKQAEAELNSTRLHVINNTLQLVWGHDFYHEEKDKRHWRGGPSPLQKPEDIRKLLESTLRIVNLALDEVQVRRAIGTEPPEVDDDELYARLRADPAIRFGINWEEAKYWLLTLLQKHADPSSGDHQTQPLEPPRRWDPERPNRSVFDKEFKNADDKTVDLKDPRYHLVVQDAGAEDMDEEDYLAQIEAAQMAKDGEPRKKVKMDPAFEPGTLKKSRLRGKASQRQIERVWFYKPKERLDTTHARLLQFQALLPGKEHELAFLRQQLFEGQTVEANAQIGQTTNSTPEASSPDQAALQSSGAECGICFEPKVQIGVLPCYHSFCVECIDTLCENTPRSRYVMSSWNMPRCPSCRLKFSPDRVTRIMERGRSASTDGFDEVAGDWSGKISGVILDLKARLAQDPTHKAVIFSHWPKMLSFVRDAMTQNDVPAVVFGGNEAKQSEALRAIRDDDDVRVILVPFRASAGAAGLTLTSCDLAYLMEPALDIALEAQAVARIHRIGQRRETTILRVKMKDTIEDAVMRVAEERSRRGMALATHAAPGIDIAGAQSATVEADVAAAGSSAAAESSGASSSRTMEGLGQPGAASSSVHVKLEREDTMPLAPAAPNLRERSIKASVGASVGAGRESDNTSLTMAEVGLILGFDVGEEKRKSSQRRASLQQRAVGVWGYEDMEENWVDELSERELDDLEEELAMEEEEMAADLGMGDDDLDVGDDDDNEVLPMTREMAEDMEILNDDGSIDWEALQYAPRSIVEMAEAYELERERQSR